MKSLFTILFLILALVVDAQKTGKNKTSKTTLIEMQGADKLIYNEKTNAAQRLIGNVRVKHENTMMYCDSAWFYVDANILKAFGRIHVKQGDTLNLYGDSLHFDGNTKTGKLRGHIRLVEQDMHLETDSIEFNTEEGCAWYSNWGTITSVKNKNVLRSKKGEYRSSTKELFFKDSVTLKNPEYEMYGDTLKYMPETSTAYFLGPTVIRGKDLLIYTDKGWYNTKTEKSLLTGRSYVVFETNYIKGDTILYDRKTGKGEAHGYFEAIDTVNKGILSGEYGIFDQEKGSMMTTGKALLTMIFEKDSLFLHADTLRGYKSEEAGGNKTFAYYNVRFFKSDLQGKCDSLVYNESDSLMRMYKDPILWNEENQLSADYMQLLLVENKVKQITLLNNCFISSKADTVGFNQIKGKTILGKFKNDELEYIEVTGNGESVYYAGEDKSANDSLPKKYTGMNKLECSSILIYIENSEISRINFVEKPTAVFYPIDKINPKDRILKGFKWSEELRPKNKFDVLRHTKP